MASDLNNAVTNEWEVGKADLTGTRGPADATRLVTGTVVNLLGIGNTTANSDFRVRVKGIAIFPTAPQRSSPRTTSIRVVKRGTRAARRGPRLLELRDPLRVVYPEAQGKNVADLIVVQEKIRMGKSSNPGVKLVGVSGSARPPKKKYYDLDLDAYQLD